MFKKEAAPFSAGKFLITPLSRLVQGGAFTASLSIRRGQGRQTHDRIYTFKPEFATRDSALMYAAAQGRDWLVNPTAFA
jgi:hypothetical protein